MISCCTGMMLMFSLKDSIYYFVNSTYMYNCLCKTSYFSLFQLTLSSKRYCIIWLLYFLSIHPALFHTLTGYLHSPLRISARLRPAVVGQETLTFRPLINLKLVKIHQPLVQTVRFVGFSSIKKMLFFMKLFLVVHK
jgi:hypothetical protein